MNDLDITRSKVFENSNWTVWYAEDYLIIDPKEQTCTARNVRFLSPTSFVIDHPVATSCVIDTEVNKELPYVFRGNLEANKHKTIEFLKKFVGVHLGGVVTKQRRKQGKIS